MKVLAPICSHDELEMLAASGAEELYCGIVPREWMERYTGAVWLNRRSPKGGSLETYAELKARGVVFDGAPEKQPWGTFAKFRDSEGNQFVLGTPK